MYAFQGVLSRAIINQEHYLGYQCRLKEAHHFLASWGIFSVGVHWTILPGAVKPGCQGATVAQVRSFFMGYMPSIQPKSMRDKGTIQKHMWNTAEMLRKNQRHMGRRARKAEVLQLGAEVIS